MVNGIQEANPFVRFAMRTSPNPVGGLLAVKVLAVLLGLYCWRRRRTHVLSRINLLFACVVAWNLAALIIGSLHPVT
jgi:hypothetical protein